MKTLTRWCAVILFGMAGFTGLRGAVWMGPLFTDHAVLQRGKPVPVWGHGQPGEKITVTFLGQAVEAVTGKDERWVATLAPMEANSTGSDLVAKGNDTVTLHDVVVGEVWLASGQSNMEMTVDYPAYPVFRVVNSAAESASAHEPLIREFKVAKISGPRPNDVVSEFWQCSQPDTVKLFSATGYFFAREIFGKLHVPVGIINSSYGATPIEAWMSRTSLEENSVGGAVKDRWNATLEAYAQKWRDYAAWALLREKAARGDMAAAAAAQAQTKGRTAMRPPSEVFGPDTPGGLYDGMIDPLLPCALRGFLWYQGEANTRRPGEYHALLTGLIEGWRRSFNQGELPFFWVQLPNFSPGGDAAGRAWALFREGQDQTLAVPATGQAVTIDIGESKNIHPANKQDVGHRLALLAEAKVYGLDVVWTGPRFTNCATEGSGMRVRFSEVHGQLKASGGVAGGFEIAGADQHFYPAQATIDGAGVIVKAEQVKEPVAVRYAFTNDPRANLKDESGLPAVPFRSDNW